VTPWILACAVCLNGANNPEGTRAAFLATTIFMSSLPLLFVGAVIGGFWWRTRRQR
jgi:hypothetical protein